MRVEKAAAIARGELNPDFDYGEEDDGEEYETEPDDAETADTAQDAE